VSDLKTLVDLKYVKYQGAYNATLECVIFTNMLAHLYDLISIRLISFLGIPYAIPPLGNLRWRAPEPIEKSLKPSYSRSAVNATEWRRQCVQGQPAWARGLPNGILALSDPAIEDEDCLILNVHIPSHPRSNRLPVLVNIHGGGYIQGSSRAKELTAFTSSADGNLISVSIQYRLGVYGFLGSSEVRSDGTANAGLLDQRAALEWINRNIAAFGGDPDNVTIMVRNLPLLVTSETDRDYSECQMSLGARHT
jgi:carboxylesterase type B